MAKKFQIFQECRRGLVGILLINLWHFGHNFGTRKARKSIKPSEDSYYSLVSNKNSSKKMALSVWRPGPDYVNKICINILPLYKDQLKN